MRITQHSYFQVYLDFGLAIPKLSVHGMISSIKELLELAPANKVKTFACDNFCREKNVFNFQRSCKTVSYTKTTSFRTMLNSF